MCDTLERSNTQPDFQPYAPDNGVNPSNNFILIYSTSFYIHFSGFDSVAYE